MKSRNLLSLFGLIAVLILFTFAGLQVAEFRSLMRERELINSTLSKPSPIPQPAPVIIPPGYDQMELHYWSYGFGEEKRPFVEVRADKCLGAVLNCITRIDAVADGKTLKQIGDTKIENGSFYRAVSAKYYLPPEQLPSRENTLTFVPDKVQVVFWVKNGNPFTATWVADDQKLGLVGPIESPFSLTNLNRQLETLKATSKATGTQVEGVINAGPLSKFAEWIIIYDQEDRIADFPARSTDENTIRFASRQRLTVGHYKTTVEFWLPDRAKGGSRTIVEKTTETYIPLLVTASVPTYRCAEKPDGYWDRRGWSGIGQPLIFGWYTDKSGNKWVDIKEGWIPAHALNMDPADYPPDNQNGACPK